MSLLDGKNLPGQLKTMSYKKMAALAGEIRERLIQTVSETGGHLASNLGTVELTLAMHRCFDSPKDRFVFDVGHQAYTHKLLTGRLEKFATLRQENGLSGFCRPEESPHDIFSTGHAGTAVSAALGLVEGERIKGNSKSYTVAVVGDGAFTAGMIYEAMNNNRSKRGNRLIVVLNENEMSISKNVGAFAQYLADIRAKPSYHKLKADTESALRKIPLVGETAARGVHKLKSTVKNWLYSSTWFEDMGFHYIGPIDGHNLHTLVRALQSAKWLARPVVVHIHTTKGKGYHPAEQEPSVFHGVGSFDLETGEPLPSGKDYSSVFGEKLCELAARNGNVCAITAAMSLGTGLTEFSRRFPGRFFDVGIAEQHAAAFAGGLAKTGMLPVFAVYSSFFQRCYDQVWHDVAMQKQKAVFAVDRAGFVGGDGESHQGLYDVSMLSGIPGLEIFAPSSYAELEQMLEDAVLRATAPVCIRYPRGCEDPLPADYLPSGGAWELYGDASAKTTIVCYGRLFSQAAQALELLKLGGVRARVVKLNRILPVDFFAVQAAAQSKKVYFFEEGVRAGGVGERFGAALLEQGYRGEYKITAVEGGFVPQASVKSLLARYKLDSKGMAELILG
ncbi:MAG: 1-deoxy-D-xylulose-5-phosphate synthase [Clostridium sp.]|jgi:1-deoxy-D-xylulose-5-phosphate synthase|nr:1-deoxy-D-xylulose-5-phosphate synthase [Clostridium sp.]